MLDRNYVCVETTITQTRDLLDLGSRFGTWGFRSDLGGERFIRIPPLSFPDLNVDYAYLEPGRFGNGELKVEYSVLTHLAGVIDAEYGTAVQINAAATLALALDYSASFADWKPEYRFVGIPYSIGDGVDLALCLEELVVKVRPAWLLAGVRPSTLGWFDANFEWKDLDSYLDTGR